MLCKVTIVMPDGSRGKHVDEYPNPAIAFKRAQRAFPSALRIAVIRLSKATTQGACQ
jgi:hypothetical protein